MRAVNQSVGRVIRNIRDYGAIVLCDERYMDPQLQGMLSAWMRPCVQGMRNFGQLSASLAAFFRQKHEAPPQQQQQSSVSTKEKETKQPEVPEPPAPPPPQQQQPQPERKPSGKSYLVTVCAHTHTLPHQPLCSLC